MSSDSSVLATNPGERLVGAEFATRFTLAVEPASVNIIFAAARHRLNAEGQIEAPGIRHDPVAVVALSPVIAKDLAKVLSDAISQYEKEIGPIPSLDKPQR